ncbi:MAG: polyprenyl synthetase family protein [Chitinophagales bacterium]|nr:polyprenyl synthetase family protein [Chitinophagales bacterium]
MQLLSDLRVVFNEYLESQKFTQKPDELYQPNNYFLGMGGKRIRPVLVLLGSHLYNQQYQTVLPASIAIEYFHNFSLIHDDIMDNAPLRRGQTTVHEKYGNNTAILSGDALLVFAYKYISKVPEQHLKEVLEIFTQTAIEVCEGQQLDMNFETQEVVTEEEYIEMICKKTSVVIAAGLKIGAIIGGAPVSDTEALYQYAIHLGLAFQIQDDILDCYGNEELVGKQPGGDIIQNKKTLLLIRAKREEEIVKSQELEQILNDTSIQNKEKIKATLKIFDKHGILASVENTRDKYIASAISYLDKTSLSTEKKKILLQLIDYLVRRDY